MAHVLVERFGDRYLIAVSASSFELDLWTSQGYVRVPTSKRWFAARGALYNASYEQLALLWEALFHVPARPPWQRDLVQADLHQEVARGSRALLLVKEVQRGYVGERVKPEGVKPIPRLDTEHFLAVQAVDEDERPVASVELELTLMGGELRMAHTGSDGFVRLSRLRSASAIVRVVSLDGSMWQPLDGAPAEFSSNDNRLRWHRVAQGECLSAIALRYGLPSWKKIWHHPQNAPLRNRRKSPHVLMPGDDVAVPSLDVYEIVRPTDATHRIQVKAPAPIWIRLNLLDKQRKPIERGDYKILLEGQLHAEGSIEQGKVECAVPVYTKEAVLVARAGSKTIRRRLHVSALDPLEEVSGLQARLSNLGHFVGEIDGENSEALQLALREFRATAGLREGEQRDDELRSTLEREHLV